MENLFEGHERDRSRQNKPANRRQMLPADTVVKKQKAKI